MVGDIDVKTRYCHVGRRRVPDHSLHPLPLTHFASRLFLVIVQLGNVFLIIFLPEFEFPKVFLHK